MRLIEWDSLELRVNAARLNELVRAQLASRPGDVPIERLELQFAPGRMRIAGIVRKFIAVPFSVDVTRILASGTTVRVPLEGAAAFGAIPIPQFLFRFAKDRLPRDLVSFEEPATFVLSMERFLPPFLAAEIRDIRITEGGLSVTLGAGGADAPPDLMPGGRRT